MDLLRSKKFQAASLGLIVAIGGHFGFDLDSDILLTVLSPILAYIAGQGLADFGKERAKKVVENGDR